MTSAPRDETMGRTFAHAVFDGADVGILATDACGLVTFADATAAGILGAAPRRHVGRDVRSVLGLPSAPDVLVGAAKRVVRAQTVRVDGEEDLEIELAIHRVEGAAPHADGFFVILRDLRVERQREEERRRLERLASMGTMVAGFAHEVRNPLAALRSLAESLAEDLSTERGIRMPHLARMLEVLERVERLVRTSLQFGRPDPPCRAEHRPWSVLAQALTAIGPRARAHGGLVQVDVEPDLPDLVVDASQVVQILVILLDNAIDATGSAPRVLLRAGLVTGGDGRAPMCEPTSAPFTSDVEIQVVDDGPGVPADLMGRIFDPFYTTKASGTGLGLSIAQQLVSENGGRLEVTSSRGRTCFSVRLPGSARRAPSVRPLPSLPPPDSTA